ncbi:MFS general substrate transporter [Mycena sanguinolenta]|nr:MFS general substrate transporter [Mycena sanguinolenta]
MNAEDTPSQSASLRKTQEAQSEPAVFEVPDSGIQAWCTVVGSWLVLFSTFGFAYAFGVFEDFYVRVYLSHRSPSSISWIGSVQLMLPYFLAPFVGKVFDDGGFHKLEMAGGLIFAFCVFMLSLAKPQQYYQVPFDVMNLGFNYESTSQIFLAQGIGMGIGIALTFLPSITILYHHFKRHRALASGIALSGSSIGAAIFPIVLKQENLLYLHLIPRLGFATAIRVSGAVLTPCLVVGNLLMRTRVPPKPQRPSTAETMERVKSFFADPPYVWCILGFFLGFIGLYFPVVYIQLFSLQHGIDPSIAFYSVTMLNASGTLFRLFGTHWADIYGPFTFAVICSLGAGAMMWAMLGVHNTASLVIISLLYGTFYSTWLALGFPCMASLAKGPEEIGLRGGVGLIGALLGEGFHWIRPIAFSAVTGLTDHRQWQSVPQVVLSWHIFIIRARLAIGVCNKGMDRKK